MKDKQLPFNSSPALWEKLKPLARQKRHVPTDAEQLLWQQVRNRRIEGAKFRRQHTIGPFIVDFVCLDAMLIVEVDGPIHDYTVEEDEIRQAWLEEQGFQVLRFSNQDVRLSVDTVLDRIGEALHNRLS